jgi:lipid-binding SYLF domain-containing protein
MTTISRRAFIGIAAAALAAGSARAASRAGIDAAVARAIAELSLSVTGAAELMERAKGYLVMADVTKAGLLVGGEYGEGTLFVGGAPVEYYSVAAASLGLQAGVQRSHQVLFFLTEAALLSFRTADGWEAGADVELTMPDDGLGLNLNTISANRPVVGFIFGRNGFLAGASLEGAKYSRIVR